MANYTRFKEKHINLEPNKTLKLGNRTDNLCLKMYSVRLQASYTTIYAQEDVFWNCFDHCCF